MSGKVSSLTKTELGGVLLSAIRNAIKTAIVELESGIERLNEDPIWLEAIQGEIDNARTYLDTAENLIETITTARKYPND